MGFPSLEKVATTEGARGLPGLPSIKSVEEKIPEEKRVPGKGFGFAAKEIGKSVVRGVETAAGTFAGGAGALSEMASTLAPEGSMLRDVLANMGGAGKDAMRFWEKESMRGIEAPDPSLFQGSFMQNPSWLRAGTLVGGALPSLFTAALITKNLAPVIGAGKAAWTGAGVLGFGLEAPPTYWGAREADKSIGKAGALYATHAIGATVLEHLPLKTMLGYRTGKGSVIRALGKELRGKGRFARKAAYTGAGVAEVGAQEATEEFSQQLLGNVLAKFGYDKTRNLTEGLVESIIAGAGSGGMLGGFSASSVQNLDRLVAQAVEAGVTENEIGAIQMEAAIEIEADAEKIDKKLKSLGAAAAGTLGEGDIPKLKALTKTERDSDYVKVGKKKIPGSSLFNLKSFLDGGMEVGKAVNQVIKGGVGEDNIKVDAAELREAYERYWSDYEGERVTLSEVEEVKAEVFPTEITAAKKKLRPLKYNSVASLILLEFGGLSLESKKDFPDLYKRMPKVFKRGGRSIDDIAKSLQEEASGYGRKSEDVMQLTVGEGENPSDALARAIGDNDIGALRIAGPEAERQTERMVEKAEAIEGKAEKERTRPQREFIKQRRAEIKGLRENLDKAVKEKGDIEGARAALDESVTSYQGLHLLEDEGLRQKYVDFLNAQRAKVSREKEKGTHSERIDFKNRMAQFNEQTRVAINAATEKTEAILQTISSWEQVKQDMLPWQQRLVEMEVAKLRAEFREVKAPQMSDGTTVENFVSRARKVMRTTIAPTVRVLGKKLGVAKGVLEWADFSMSRMERMAEKLGGYKQNLIRELFYDNINKSRGEDMKFQQEEAQKLKAFVDEHGGWEYLARVNKKIQLGDVQISGLVALGIYGRMRDAGAGVRILSNGIKAEGVEKRIVVTNNAEEYKQIVEEGEVHAITLEELERSMTDDHKEMYTFIRDWYVPMYDRLAAVVFSRTGKELGKVSDYFGMLRMEGDGIDFIEDTIVDQLLREGKIKDVGDPGFIKERAKFAGQPVHIGDPTIDFLTYLRRASHYVHFADAISDIGKVINTTAFRDGVVHKAGSMYMNRMDKFYKDMKEYNASLAGDLPRHLSRMLRNNSVIATLGFNILSSLRQTLSTFNAIAETSPGAVFSGWRQVVNNYKEVLAEVQERSPSVRDRINERYWLEDIKRFSHTLLGGPTWWIQANTRAKRRAMWMLRKADQLTVLAVYKGSFDMEMKRSNDEQKAMDFAEQVLRRTQPMADLKDLPHAFRAGEVMKMFTMFQNQINNNYNYWTHDIIGKFRAGEITTQEAATKVLWSYAIPAMLMGMIGRGRPPEDLEEVAQDMLTYPIASIVIVGNWINALLRGYEQTLPLPFQTIEAVGRTARGVMTGGDIETQVKYGVPAVGRMAGVPGVSQIWRTGKGISDITSGMTSDPRRLIWSEWQLKGRSKKALDLFPKGMNVRWAGTPPKGRRLKRKKRKRRR